MKESPISRAMETIKERLTEHATPIYRDHYYLDEVLYYIIYSIIFSTLLTEYCAAYILR